MYTIETEFGVVDISNEFLKSYRSTLEEGETLDGKLRGFADIDLGAVRRLMLRENYPEPRSIRMLDSHCGSKGRTFVYFDEGPKDPKLIQTWLDEHDGNYNVLYVAGCNPGKVKLQPRKSFLIYSLGENRGVEILFASIGRGMGNLVIASPTNISDTRSADLPRVQVS